MQIPRQSERSQIAKIFKEQDLEILGGFKNKIKFNQLDQSDVVYSLMNANSFEKKLEILDLTVEYKKHQELVNSKLDQ